MKMKKPVVKDNERQHLTNSSTPNFPLSSKKEGGGSSEKSLEKNDPSSDNSFDENWTFQVNFKSLQDDKFSTELMDRLKILQEGYDDDDYDNTDLFDENAVEEEIDKILNKCDEEVDKILEVDREQIEELYERIADEKFEKLAEIKAEYKYKIKFAEEEEKEQMEKDRDLEIDETIQKYNRIKEKQVEELKVKHMENKDKIKIKREGIKRVANRVRRSVSRKASKRTSGKVSPTLSKNSQDVQPNFTNLVPLMNKVELQEDLSKGLKKNSGMNSGLTMPKGPINMNSLVKTPPKERKQE